jgi:hypothetical protein
MEVRTKFSAASGKLASWFAAMEACHRAMQGLPNIFCRW